jgi:hypothetical protein
MQYQQGDALKHGGNGMLRRYRYGDYRKLAELLFV